MGVPLGAALAACGGTGPTQTGAGGGGGNATTGGGGGNSATYWYLSTQPQEGVRTRTMERHNQANPNAKIEGTTFQNDAFKTKIKTAIGAGQAPTLIWGWGGGGLRSYVQAGQVEDLTSWFDQNPAVKDKLFPSAFGAATVDGKIYAMPCETLQPIVLYYDKRAFDKIGAQPPQTWGDILDLVPKFNAKGIAPFSLGGQSRWTNMMWLEFLFDRIGGPEIFQAVFDGEKDAWNNPLAIQALGEVQKLVKADGFVKGFSSITADSNADQALLYTGKAAMMLHGGWTYGSMSTDGGDFVSGGNLGYMNFPPVDGGKGDPGNTVGNPGQYMSISSKATPEQKEIAKKFFSGALIDDTSAKEWVGTGAVPILKGADAHFATSKDKDFLTFVYNIAVNAKSFGQSWDQALSPTAAEVLLDNISKLFQLSISPQEFATNMNAVIGK
ncbi:raffinose/stachyose/melibiose transport system substrate-binding protein [Nonomuraea thailandensis]|uniref:Raffinose/stachyose/melibiose transport system substrate-binding protein n=1 Tax=Nonomuraea thailandensis TaxID=1188745 RepID=A0A9X2GJC9_9ACTN|nr:extracellular solute-binding protein [Nonomuraea thailandensis]MCP2358752.1 raffinose/stachyose/melibiose transport system substrate-binding protein [Nonomuraea thailandensis]